MAPGTESSIRYNLRRYPPPFCIHIRLLLSYLAPISFFTLMPIWRFLSVNILASVKVVTVPKVANIGIDKQYSAIRIEFVQPFPHRRRRLSRVSEAEAGFGMVQKVQRHS